jgi:pimeloyl-ACP methyl ester carboxylesterase
MVSKIAKEVVLGSASYPVTRFGTGDKACLVVGLGTLMENTLSQKFKSDFTLYVSDLYWHESHKLTAAEVKACSMEKFSRDLHSVAQQLGLSNYFLLAHSAFGILALDVAKQATENDPTIAGIILIGAPPAWNDSTIEFAKKYFEENATPARKENNKQRKAHYEMIKKPTDSEASWSVYVKDSARYWFDFHVSEQFLQDVWKGVKADDGIINELFLRILPNYKVEDNLDVAKIPPCLIVGEPFDFDCVPLELWKVHPAGKLLKEKMTIVACSNSGHWPNVEEPELFDQQVNQWAMQQKISGKIS